MSDRRPVLLELLTQRDFFNQSDVVEAMKRKGFAVTQASISRDFKELGVAKICGMYRPASGIITGSLQSSVRGLIRSIEFVGDNLAVVKTSSGAAGAAAEAIDLEDIPGVVGTIAGDNTIFIATKNKKAHELIKKRIGNL
jgi:transcriptional regulator of arginine metabolism